MGYYSDLEKKLDRIDKLRESKHDPELLAKLENEVKQLAPEDWPLLLRLKRPRRDEAELYMPGADPSTCV